MDNDLFTWPDFWMRIATGQEFGGTSYRSAFGSQKSVENSSESWVARNKGFRYARAPVGYLQLSVVRNFLSPSEKSEATSDFPGPRALGK
jgi:hypothetical protein